MLEIIGFDLEGCEIAQSSGASRIELCLDPHLGGTTPDDLFIKKARSLLNIPLFVMVRPRGGDFNYNKSELDQMFSTIDTCKKEGVDGVVFGVLDESRELNRSVCEQLVEAASGISCTFHRAFDVVDDPIYTAKEIVKLGFSRILTSGQKDTALDGTDLIKTLLNRFSKKLTILPGAGITSHSLPLLHRVIGAKEYHSSAKKSDKNGTYLGVDATEVRLMAEFLNENLATT